VKEPCGGKVGTGHVEDGVAVEEAAVEVEMCAVAAADTAFISRSSALTPGSRKPAAIIFVAGSGLGWRLDRRELVGGKPRLRQAFRARSLLADAASSLSSLRREVDS
jgi:hypothetical protein